MRHIFISLLFVSFLFSQNAWINEFHYDDVSGDDDEALEVVIENPSSYTLADFAVTLYNGSNNGSYDTKTLDQFTAGNSEGNFTIYSFVFPANGIQNGAPDGIALSYQNNLISGQFLSYEGTMTGSGGPADGILSTDVGVEETNSTVEGTSIQLTGSGTQFGAFSWTVGNTASLGALNPGQTFEGTLFPEPSNHVTNFIVSDSNSVSITLGWTGSIGDQLPSKYLILASTGSAGFPMVQDSLPLDNDEDWNDGQTVFNVVHQDGENSYTISGLNESSKYMFKIYSYTNYGMDINYKTDGDVPAVSGTTTQQTLLSIEDIQKTTDGQEGDSPLKGEVVKTAGIVTGVNSSSGFYIQDAEKVWSGIYVHDAQASSVTLGDSVSVTATVDEYYNYTQLGDVSSLTVVSQGNSLPNPLVVTSGQFSSEEYEGVLITVKAAECTNADLGHGEWEINDGSGACAVNDLMYAFTPSLGSAYNVTGLGDYSFSAFKIEPRSAEDISLVTDSPVITNLGLSAKAPLADEAFIDTVQVTDSNGSISLVEFVYTVNGGSSAKLVMSTAGNDSTFAVTLPADTYSDGDRIEFWAEAEDNDMNRSEGEHQGFFAGVTPLANLKDRDADEVLLYKDYYARTTGVATVENSVLDTTHLSVFIQDDAFSAVNVFQYDFAKTPIIKGHSYTVLGQVDQYSGSTQLRPDNPETDITDNGEATMPDPLEANMATLLSAAETFEGVLVQIANVDTISGTDPWPNPGSWANITVSDDQGSSQLSLHIKADTDLSQNPEPNWPVRVVGLFNQYDTESPLDEGYQIMPRSMADITTTAIENNFVPGLPTELKLYPAYPNPFNPQTHIRFDMPLLANESGNMELAVFNSLGQKVKTLALHSAPGQHLITWNGKTDNGLKVSSGVYYAVLKAGKFQQSIKLLLIK